MLLLLISRINKPPVFQFLAEQPGVLFDRRARNRAPAVAFRIRRRVPDSKEDPAGTSSRGRRAMRWRSTEVGNRRPSRPFSFRGQIMEGDFIWTGIALKGIGKNSRERPRLNGGS
jgi:hypothetical protein